MENKDKKLDDLYRDKLKDFKLPVSAQVLANIKKELEAENQKGKFGFGTWLFAIIIIGGLVAGGYFMLNNSSNVKLAEGKEGVNQEKVKVKPNSNVPLSTSIKGQYTSIKGKDASNVPLSTSIKGQYTSKKGKDASNVPLSGNNYQ